MDRGSQLGCSIDPNDLSILVFLRYRQPILMENDDTLPALEGIKLNLTVDRLFDWLKMGP